MITTIDFLRHGETSGGSYYRGITDDPLTKLGWQQMNSAVASHQWDHIISSPLHRCLDFSQHLSKQTNTSFSRDSRWQEINFGDWEGKTADQINPTELTQFYHDPINNPPPNSEHYLVFQSRIHLAWNKLIRLYPNQHILVVTHAGVIRSLFPLFLKLPVANIFNLQVDLASFTRFQYFQESQSQFITLVFHNNKTFS
ncbi:MAG: histidine phosphatase family protein [Methylococcales bacterium]|nr:histidine phosphatase family protein [Methylococcales bacterium]MCK5905500.1 histidine phosphatase family protein [Gammaproteobacteria bacterium]